MKCSPAVALSFIFILLNFTGALAQTFFTIERVNADGSVSTIVVYMPGRDSAVPSSGSPTDTGVSSGSSSTTSRSSAPPAAGTSSMSASTTGARLGGYDGHRVGGYQPSTVQPITFPTASDSSPSPTSTGAKPSTVQMAQKRVLIIGLFFGSSPFVFAISLVAKRLVSRQRWSAARRDIEAALGPELADETLSASKSEVVDRPVYPWKSVEASARNSTPMEHDSEFVSSEDCPPPWYTAGEHSI
ncbi:hypothetical protein FB45DRAFT_1065228 [Roridomyces roridus]|uniref:Transmembrane protein n=1 Tax=Roridomyces roridus TaxID=1738132 RepID=A0AAD7B8N9_9AGAR|nr:hypothetical protein FB45DRAFT_1065228 [Roridomyces roridus]